MLLVRWVVPGVARRTLLAVVASDGWARLGHWGALAARLELELVPGALRLLVDGEVEAFVAPHGGAAGGSGGRWPPVPLPRLHCI